MDVNESSVITGHNIFLYVQNSLDVTHKLITILSLLRIIRDRTALNFKHNKYANCMFNALRSDLILNHKENDDNG